MRSASETMIPSGPWRRPSANRPPTRRRHRPVRGPRSLLPRQPPAGRWPRRRGSVQHRAGHPPW